MRAIFGWRQGGGAVPTACRARGHPCLPKLLPSMLSSPKREWPRQECGQTLGVSFLDSGGRGSWKGQGGQREGHSLWARQDGGRREQAGQQPGRRQRQVHAGRSDPARPVGSVRWDGPQVHPQGTGQLSGQAPWTLVGDVVTPKALLSGLSHPPWVAPIPSQDWIFSAVTEGAASRPRGAAPLCSLRPLAGPEWPPPGQPRAPSSPGSWCLESGSSAGEAPAFLPCAFSRAET